MDEKGKNDKPQVMIVSDLVRLNSRQRLRILGTQDWLSRRKFLRCMLGTAAVFSMPSIIASCGGSSSDSQFLTVENVWPTQGAITGNCDLMIVIAFNKLADRPTVESRVSISPAAAGSYIYSWDTAGDKDNLYIYDSGGTFFLQANTFYQLTINAGCSADDGSLFDGDGDDVAGGSFYLSFTTGGEPAICTCEAFSPCSCEADSGCGCEFDGLCKLGCFPDDPPCSCEAYTPCSCDADSCYTGCLCEVQCGCQLYRI